MKILLINPPRSPHNAILAFAPEAAKKFIHKKLIGPPLGLITIAGALKDHDVTVLDTKGEYDLNPDAGSLAVLVTEYLTRSNPDIVGVTTITSEFDVAMEILRTVKGFNPRILTVAGGLHVTLLPQDCTPHPVDIVIPGQAAPVFRELVNAVQQNVPPASVKGIFIRTGDTLEFTGGRTATVDAAGADFVFPAREHLRRWVQTYRVPNAPGPTTYLFTSLGCPYGCSFCSIWPQFNGAYTQRTIDSIISELQTLDDYPVVRFADANTIVNVSFIDRLFDRIAQEGIRKEYVMDIRADTVVENPALIEKLARAGLKVVISGFESFRDEELNAYRKTSKAALIHQAIDIMHNSGIGIRGNYVVPPQYGPDDFDALADYANSHRVVYAGYTILTPMPGTDLYRQEKNAIVDKDYAKYNFFNAVTRTVLPVEEFHRRVGELWLIKKGSDVI